MSYTAVEEQWESNSAMKVNKLATPLLRKWPVNVLVNPLERSTGELSDRLYLPSMSFSATLPIPNIFFHK
jgi:hypothetical protein